MSRYCRTAPFSRWEGNTAVLDAAEFPYRVSEYTRPKLACGYTLVGTYQGTTTLVKVVGCFPSAQSTRSTSICCTLPLIYPELLLLCFFLFLFFLHSRQFRFTSILLLVALFLSFRGLLNPE